MGDHVGHGEGRVWIQRDGRYLELLIAEAGGVERLKGRWSRERTEAKADRGEDGSKRGMEGIARMEEEKRKKDCKKSGWRSKSQFGEESKRATRNMGEYYRQ